MAARHVPVLALFLLALPLATLYQGHRHDLLVATFLSAAAMAAVALVGRRPITASWTLIDVTVLALSGWLVIATIASPVAMVSVNDLLALSLFVFAYSAARTTSADQRLALGLLGATGVVALTLAVFALADFAGGVSRPSGPFINRNNFVAFLFFASMFGGAALHVWYCQRPTHRIFLAGIAAAIALSTFWVMGLSGSRGAMLGAVAGLMVLALLLRGRVRSVIPLVYGGGAVIGIIAANLSTDGSVLARAETLANPELAGASRFIIWQSVLPLIAERPLLGYGPGVLFLVWPPYRHPMDASAGFHAHNDVLAFALVGGIPAAVLFVALLALTLWTSLRGSQATEGDVRTPRDAWLVAGLMGVAAHSLFTFNFSAAGILLLAGIVVGLVAPRARPIRSPALLGAVRVGRGSLVGVGAMLIIYAATSLVGYRHHLAAQAAEHAGRPLLAYAHASQAIRWWPAADSWRLQRANILLRSVLQPEHAAENPNAAHAFHRASDDVADALRLNPYRPHGYVMAARLALAGGKLGLVVDSGTVAAARARDALAHDPRALAARRLLAELAQAQGDPEDALAILMEGLHFWYPRHTRKEYLEITRALAQRLGDDQALERIPAE